VKYRDVIGILTQNGFELVRHKGTSHRRYRGIIEGRIMLVTISCHRESDEVLPDTLASIIRQSGLPKKLFKNWR
jgi:predicted RNA binding protein YcfA (HicA-like mRNA interferase family)